jgi:hypothetical protein
MSIVLIEFSIEMNYTKGVTAKCCIVFSTLHHSSVITDGPGRDIIAGPGRRQHFAILGFT